MFSTFILESIVEANEREHAALGMGNKVKWF